MKKKIIKLLLDILIKNEKNRFSTLFYRKKTLTDLFTKFNSFTPVSYNIELAICLIHAVFKVSSSYIILHNESEKIKILLQKNICPTKLLIIKLKLF